MSTATLPATLAGTYTIDPSHTRLGFVARHAMVTKVRGNFNDFSGSGYLDPENPSDSNVAVTIQATSIDTRNEDRDNHLRSNDFFAMEQYPTLQFESTMVEQLDPDTFRVTGDLTIKAVTKSVAIDFDYEGAATDPFGNQRVGFEGSLVVNRKDFGLEWNAPLDTGGVLVSDKVTLEFEISAIKQHSDS